MSLTLYVAHALVFNLVVDWSGWVRPTGLDTALMFAAVLLDRRHRRRQLVAPAVAASARRVAVPAAGRLSGAARDGATMGT